MAETTLAPVARALTARADRPGIFSGYASLFGVADSQGDRVEAGAFRPSLEAWRASGRRPAMLWQHDPAEPIGLWTQLEEDSVGLRVEGRLLLSVRSGAEAYEHIKAGTVTGLSIGYQTVEAHRDRKTGIRHLVRVTLWEISLVTFPANHEARVATVKAGDDLPDARARLARALRRVVLTRPLLPFLDAAERKNSVDYARRHGHPQPRDDGGRYADGGGVRPLPAALLSNGDAMAAVDWDFIGECEGGRRLKGYVPKDGEGKALANSGVTVATGFDLGSHSEEDLRRLGIDPAIVDKLRPYLRLKGGEARRKLKEEPLNLSKDEAGAIDMLKRADTYRKVRESYDNAVPAGVAKFDDLPVEARTTILSVGLQYGSNLAIRTPNFWECVTLQDWPGAIGELRNFHDAHPTRRGAEADYLQRMLDRGSSSAGY